MIQEKSSEALERRLFWVEDDSIFFARAIVGRYEKAVNSNEIGI